MSEDTKKVQGELSDDQLDSVAGGLSDRHRQEFESGLGNKGLSGRHKDEFEAGLGNKGAESDPENVGQTFEG
ncbi:MAG: hypothetical protein AAGA75_05050 [Cyanobacteria bacterium P01_E01_bin.6]